jgi:hypothetical protein
MSLVGPHKVAILYNLRQEVDCRYLLVDLSSTIHSQVNSRRRAARDEPDIDRCFLWQMHGLSLLHVCILPAQPAMMTVLYGTYEMQGKKPPKLLIVVN